MGKFRIYPDKSNTLIEGTEINTGNNGVMELWYGNEGRARHLTHFNFDTYNFLYSLGYVPHITATTATFNMKNCYPIYETNPFTTARAASAVEIEVKVVQQEWAGGVGHDFYGTDTVDAKSNWYCATTVNHWALAGGDFAYTVFSGMVDKGDESISLPITDEIELWNTFTGDNYGLCVKYTDAVEALSGDTKAILKYFTENARTSYYTPYIELEWDSDQVTDQRDELSFGLTRRLYLYIRYYDQFTSPNDISGVTINYDHPSYTDEEIPASAITQQYPGVYYIDYTGPAEQVGDSTFTDTWWVQFNPTNGYDGIVQNGDLSAGAEQWNTGQSQVLQSIDYPIHMPNLSDHYHRGNIIYLDVNAHEPFTSNVVVLKNMEYKVDLVDCTYHFPIVDWSPVSYTQDSNGFPMDTEWLLPNYDYEIEFRYSVNGAVSKTSDNRFKFRILE